MSRQVEFKGRVGTVQVQNTQVNHAHHHWAESAPPDDPEMSEQCFQCKRLTWRYTAHCVHCGVGLKWRRWCRRVFAALRVDI